jgi:anti-sigma factor RsiW
MMAGDMNDRCDMVLLVQAEFDGELDAARAADLAVHRAHCPVCQAAEAELTRARELFQGDLYQPAPDDLRERILAQLDLATPAPTLARPRRFPHFAAWRPTMGGFGLGASHVRALQPGHLEDVASTDQHTVKPWFDGRIDFAPPVRDFAAAGFPLIGGRLDYIEGRPVAALVYQRGKHIIDVYVWPEAATAALRPTTDELNGYNVVHWTQDGMTFWAVSDVEPGQLRAFAAAWRKPS